MKTKPAVFRSAGVVGLGTLSSRVLGLGREMLMALTFGTGPVASAFVVAFTIPNLFRRLFGEGALSAAFIPHYVKTRDREGAAAGWTLTRNLSSLLFIGLGSLSLLSILGCTAALNLGWGTEHARTVLRLLRILFPYMIGLCLAAVAMGVLNSHRKYAVSAFTPCLLNLMWIGTLLVLNLDPDRSELSKITIVSWVILGAGFLQWGVQLPFVKNVGYTRPRQVRPLSPNVRTVLTRMAPAALGAAVTQINVLVDRLLAIWISDYGPSALAYSERLIYLPLGIFATALGTILLPEFSGLVHRKEQKNVSALLDRSLRGLLFVMLPAAVGLGVLAIPIVSLVFERGEFDATSTLVTSRALICYAPGLVIFAGLKIFVPLFHAHGDTRTPMRIGAVAVLLNIALNLLFILLLPEGWKHAGLALGTVASTAVQLIALAVLTQKRYVAIEGQHLLAAAARHTLACIPLITAAWGVHTLLSGTPRLLAVPGAILAGAGAYFLSAVLFRFPELGDLRRH